MTDSDRTIALLAARVCLDESRRRGRTAFAFTLLQWAANARRRAAACPQPRLFP